MTAAAFRSARRMDGLTQRHVAYMCGVSVETVKRWEAGKTRIPKLALEKLGVPTPEHRARRPSAS